MLRDSVQIYRDLAHPNLIRLVDCFSHGQFYTAVFEWVEGEGLFDHWNFEKYRTENIPSPR